MNLISFGQWFWPFKTILGETEKEKLTIFGCWNFGSNPRPERLATSIHWSFPLFLDSLLVQPASSTELFSGLTGTAWKRKTPVHMCSAMWLAELGWTTNGRLSAFGLLATMRSPSCCSRSGNPKRDSPDASRSREEQAWRRKVPRIQTPSLQVLRQYQFGWVGVSGTFNSLRPLYTEGDK